MRKALRWGSDNTQHRHQDMEHFPQSPVHARGCYQQHMLVWTWSPELLSNNCDGKRVNCLMSVTITGLEPGHNNRPSVQDSSKPRDVSNYISFHQHWAGQNKIRWEKPWHKKLYIKSDEDSLARLNTPVRSLRGCWILQQHSAAMPTCISHLPPLLPVTSAQSASTTAGATPSLSRPTHLDLPNSTPTQSTNAP